MRHTPRSRVPKSLSGLLLIFAGFAAATILYSLFLEGGLRPNEMLGVSVVSALTFWVVNQFYDADSEELLVTFLERFCLGTGANLLVHALLTYAFFVRRTPFLIAVGGLFAAAFLTLQQYRTSGRQQLDSRILLIGFDAIAAKIVGSLRQPVLGMIGREGSVLPKEIPFLGNLGACPQVLRDYSPTHIVIGTDDWDSGIAPSLLLNCRLGGTVVEDSLAVYERLFHRISCERLQPMDLILSSALRGDSRTMAIQAVYTNLIGLFFLIALAPLLFVVALAVAVSSGAPSALESVDCAGFRYIPFRLLRFRTTRLDGSGEMTWVGRAISRLHLVNLPHLINVVRGEMALVGPRPVRREFAYFLTERMPFYSHRVSVKPGIFGWAQMHLPWEGVPANECLQVEYDLYYIKQSSPWLDAQILLAAPLRGAWQPRPPSPRTAVAEEP